MNENLPNMLDSQVAMLNHQLMNLSLTVEYLYYRLDTLGIDVDAQGFQDWATKRMKELSDLMKDEDLLKELHQAYEKISSNLPESSDTSEK
jgi:hypothetical protein